MAEDAHHIRRFVELLIRRERGLLALRIVARAALLLLCLLAATILASLIRADRGAATMGLVTLGGIGAWIAVAWPLLLEWGSTGDALRQARRVEALRPELRGRLVTAVDHGIRSEGGAQPLLALVVRRAASALKGLRADEVHDAKPALKWLGGATLLWVGVLPMLLVASGGPRAVAQFWLSGTSAHATIAGLEVIAPEELARVGDLVIRYTYPGYTGLDPKIVPNSTGDVTGPPGTLVEVTARSGEVVEAAGLVAYDEALEATLSDAGRTVTASFSVRAQEGSYHLLLYRDGTPEPSRDFRILPNEDLPPEVMLDAGQQEVLEVALDEPFELLWQARDDYGIRRVGLALDGRDLDRVLKRPERRVAEVGDRLLLTPRDLSLQPGSRVRLAVVAWDNDTVSGSKRGSSREVEIVVLGARGLDRRAAERRDELLEKMIPILARFLTEPWPPGDRSGELAAWGETVSRRYEPFVDAVESVWSGMSNNTHDRAIAQRIVDTGRDLVRYTQVSFLPGSAEIPRDDAFQMTAELRESAIEALEDGILAFHRMQRNQALAALVEAAADLEQMAEQMSELLASEDPDAQALLSRLDQLERMMEQLAQSAAKLEESGLREFLNTRENEAASLMEEIRDAIAEGRLDEAQELMERLSKLVEEMGQGIRDEMERRTQQGEDAQDQAGDLKAELEALEAEQRKLQSEVAALRETDSSSADRMADLWAKLSALAEQHRLAAQGYVQGLEEHDRAFYERERARAGADEAEDLRSAVTARDARGARSSVGEGRRAWGMAARALEVEQGSRRRLPGPGAQQLAQLMRQLDQIEALLDQLARAEQQMDPQTLQRSQELQDRQRDLDNRLRQAQQEAQQLEQQFPVRPEGMSEALQDAGQRMEQAAQDLDGGQLMQAEGSQGVAAQRIRDAIESLEQAQEQAQQQAQQLGGGGGEQRPGEQGEGGEERGEDHHDQQTNNLEIPGREEFRTPEEYRRALLEGMEGEVPEEYRAMKRRYYEELVHQ